MITPASSRDYPEIIEVWAASVKATHDFLPNDYFQEIRELLPSILPEVQLFVYRNENSDSIRGFLGLSADKIEMLFIDPTQRGTGIGRLLTRYAIDEWKITKVDVNEQNGQAVGFYRKMGFVPVKRNELDGMGRPFPIVELQLA